MAQEKPNKKKKEKGIWDTIKDGIKTGLKYLGIGILFLFLVAICGPAVALLAGAAVYSANKIANAKNQENSNTNTPNASQSNGQIDTPTDSQTNSQENTQTNTQTNLPPDQQNANNQANTPNNNTQENTNAKVYTNAPNNNTQENTNTNAKVYTNTSIGAKPENNQQSNTSSNNVLSGTLASQGERLSLIELKGQVAGIKTSEKNNKTMSLREFINKKNPEGKSKPLKRTLTFNH